MGRGGAAFPTGVKWEAVAHQAGAAALPDLQRRRVRAGHVQGPRRDRGRSVLADRGDDDRRLRDRLRARLRLPARRVPAGARDPGRGARRGAPARLPRRRRARRGLRVRHRDPQGRRRLHLRRGDGDLQLDRGLPRRAAQQAALPGGRGPVRQADRRQQRRDAGQRARRSCSTAGRATPRRAPRVRAAPKLFCLSGNVERPGVYEVPFGTTLRELLDAGRRRGRRARAPGRAAGRRGRRLPAARRARPAAHVRGRARGQDDARLGRRAGARRPRRPAALPAADRRLLPRRVVRSVRAVPGGHGAPAGGARAARLGPHARRRGRRARAGRRDRPVHARRLDLRPRPDGLERDRIGNRAPRRLRGCDSEQSAARAGQSAWSSSRSTGGRCACFEGQTILDACASSTSRRRRCATATRCSRPTPAASAWSSSRARACSRPPARARPRPA